MGTAFSKLDRSAWVNYSAVGRSLVLSQTTIQSVIPKRVQNFNLWFNSGLKKYVRSDADGSGDGSTNSVGGASGAWTIAQLNAASVTAWTWVVYTGVFSTFVGNGITLDDANVLHDFRNAATTPGVLVPTSAWVPTGVNGEYKSITSMGLTDRYCTLTEDKNRMVGWSIAYSGINLIATATPGGNAITIKGWAYQPRVNDVIGIVTASLIGLTLGIKYYILSATAVTLISTDYVCDITVSLTPGGAPVTISAFSGTPRFWTLSSDLSTPNPQNQTIPIPGRLNPGEFAFAPWDGVSSNIPAIYMKPTNGTPANHEYYVCKTAAVPCMTISAANVSVWGGTHFGCNGNGITITVAGNRAGFWGVTQRAAQDGVIAGAAGNVRMGFCEVFDVCSHASISTDITNLESSSYLFGNAFHDLQRLITDFSADAQAMISSPGSIHGVWLDNVSWNCGRLIDHSITIPYGYPTNFATVGLDSTSYTRIAGNYFEQIPGAVVFSLPCQNNAPSGVNYGNVNNWIYNNVIDLRNSSNPKAPSSLKNTWFRLRATGTGPYPNGNHVIENNLILCGDTTFVNTSAASSNLFCENSQTGVVNGVTAITLTFANNVVYGGYGTLSSYFTTKYNTTGGGVEPVITTFGNVYCGPDMSAGALRYVDGVLNTTYTVAQLSTYGGGPNLVKTYAEMDALYDEYGKPRLAANGLGKFRRNFTDKYGNLRPSPPTPGPWEPVPIPIQRTPRT